MSYNLTQTLDEIQEEPLLLAALTTMGHEAALHPQPIRIRGYGHEMLPTPCEIVLPREKTSLRADIGFHRESDGRFSLVSDSFANPDMAKFVMDLRRTYHEEKAVHTARVQGMRVISRRWVDQDGRRWLQVKAVR